jgi:hypothetical protein
MNVKTSPMVAPSLERKRSATVVADLPFNKYPARFPEQLAGESRNT